MHRIFRWPRVAVVALMSAAVGSQAATSNSGQNDIELAVSAFYSGVAALEMGLFQRADADLERAARQLPEEPAVWANAGVLAMRRGDDAAAREHLDRAVSLAPENADIRLLSGLLARRAGDIDAAVESFRRAAELDPTAMKARYALAASLEDRGNPDDDRAARRLMAGLLEDDPGNPALRLEQVRQLAESGNAAALAQAVDRLKPLARSWPPAARDQLQALREASDDPGRARIEATVLRNVLLRTPAFRAGLDRLRVPADSGGEPIEHFVRTPVPASNPADPDMGLSYEPAPLAPGTPGILALPAGGAGAIINGPQEALPADPGPSIPITGGPLGADQAVAVDLLNDGSLDLVIANGNGLRLFEQDSDGRFRELDAGLGPATLGAAYHGVWAADLELDGDLDIVLGTAGQGSPVVLRNNGDGSFVERAVFQSADGLREFVWADLNGDGVPDAATLNSDGRARVFLNRRAWSFEAGDPIEGEYVAIAVADLSWDGRMELVTLSANGDLAARAEGRSKTRAQWPAMPAGALPGQASLFAEDLDNNGALDLLASASGQSAIWLTDGDGRQNILEVSLPWQVAAIRDVTGDGLLDLVGLDHEGRKTRVVGNGERAYGWQAIQPRALDNAGDNRINSFGLGGQVEIRAGLLVQRQVIDGAVVHFGLGDRRRADVAWILWPNGTSQAEFDLAPRRTVEAVQRLKGSCPWVFANDGSGLRFVTDFLWRSPLGMRVNAVDTATIAQTEDRIRIPGRFLARIDGQYEIRITAELWETHFIDAVSLLAVDHPRGTEIFVDERFSRTGPDLAPIRTGPPRPVHKVVDEQGRDWTDAARAADQRYVAGLELGRYQGITRPHHVEIDLANTNRGDHLVLLATGWVYPTDSSINVAVSQGDAVRPRGLRLEVPDGEGNWVTARPDLGFPAGKHKTMVIDLAGLFRPGAPRKLRLATNLEIYWDRLAVAERRTEPAPEPRTLAVKSASLRYRGFSETSQPRRETPEVPHYDRLQGTTQRWLDLAGYHTRFGDVRELLAAPDDRYVIMNAGDELVLRFEAPPPEGHVRDFILMGHGWVKDGDFNTAFSRTVLPLPTRSRAAYDTPPSTLEWDPVYQRHAADWRRFHTRYVNPSRFLSGLRNP